MKGTILKSCTLVLLFMASTILPYTMKVHNETGYNLKWNEFHTKGLCKVKHDVDLPKNSTTIVNWGLCGFDWASLGGTLGNTVTKDMTKLKDIKYICGDPRHVYIFSADPITRVEMPTQPGVYTDINRYVKFFLVVLPKGACRGGLQAETGWYNKITGQLDAEGAQKAGLE